MRGKSEILKARAACKRAAESFGNRMRTCRRMFRFAGQEYGGYFATLAGYFLAVTILPFGAVFFPGKIITQIEMQVPLRGLLYPALAMGVFYLLLRNLENYCKKNGEMKGEYLMIRLKMRLNRISMRAPMAVFEDAGFWDRMETAAQISYNSSYFNGYYYSFVEILSFVIQTIVIAFLISRLSPLVILLLAGSFFCSLAVDVYCQKRLHAVEKKKAALQRRTQYLENLTGDYHYGKMIRLHAIGDWLLDISREKREAFCAASREGQKWEYRIRYVSSLLGAMQELCVYLYLIWMVINRGITIGEYALYLAAVHQFSAALNGIAQHAALWNHYSYFAGDLTAFLSEEEKECQEGAELPSDSGGVRIEFDHVSFRYAQNSAWVLRDVSFVIEKGESVTLVGDNGAGKSTLLALLLRLYQPTEGRILVNGVDIQGLGEKAYRQLFSAVFQEYQTYAFNLQENVALADVDGENEEKVVKALREGGFPLEKFEKGLSTQLDRRFTEEGIELSGGEQQKLVMARAIYRESPVLILDEPTANLSPAAESKLYESFYRMAKGRTSVFVSHRLSSSRFTDRVLVLAGGRIVEDGAHDALVRGGGLYQEMFEKQASFYQEELV